MASRVKLNEHLVSLLGTRNVYFQPGATINMSYPCFIYHRRAKNETFANNMLYLGKMRYEVVYVDRDIDSEILDALPESLPYVSFDGHYVADGLNHDRFIIYY